MQQQGKFYAHQAVDKDLVHCPPPQRISASQEAVVERKTRTLQSRTDVRVCEPPQRLGEEAGGELRGCATAAVATAAVHVADDKHPAAVAAVDAGSDASDGSDGSDGSDESDSAAEANFQALFLEGAGTAVTATGDEVRVREGAAVAAEDKYQASIAAFKRSKALSSWGKAQAHEEEEIPSRTAATATAHVEDNTEDAYVRSKALAQKMMSRLTAETPPPPPASSSEVPHTVEVDSNCCVVTVGPLTGCSTASELDLNLNGPILTLNGPIFIAPLTIRLPLLLDEPTVKAKFSKKNATLTVTVTGKLPSKISSHV